MDDKFNDGSFTRDISHHNDLGSVSDFVLFLQLESTVSEPLVSLSNSAVLNTGTASFKFHVLAGYLLS